MPQNKVHEDEQRFGKYPMIVDSLTHVTPDGKWFGAQTDASERELLRQLDEARVERAVVVALAGYIENNFVFEVCDRHPDRFVPCASFNPAAFRNADEVIQNFRSEFDNGRSRALKLHPRLNRYDPLDPRCIEVFKQVSAWKKPIPILLDTLFYFRGGQLRKPVVDTIHELVGQFPSVPLVLLHGGGSWILQVAEAIRDCPNAFLDISFTLQRYMTSSIAADLRYLLGVFDRRMVFGSDFPEFGVATSLAKFHEVAGEVSADKLRNVLGANLSGLLGLENHAN